MGDVFVKELSEPLLLFLLGFGYQKNFIAKNGCVKVGVSHSMSTCKLLVFLLCVSALVVGRSRKLLRIEYSYNFKMINDVS